MTLLLLCARVCLPTIIDFAMDLLGLTETFKAYSLVYPTQRWPWCSRMSTSSLRSYLIQYIQQLMVPCGAEDVLVVLLFVIITKYFHKVVICMDVICGMLKELSTVLQLALTWNIFVCMTFMLHMRPGDIPDPSGLLLCISWGTAVTVTI